MYLSLHKSGRANSHRVCPPALPTRRVVVSLIPTPACAAGGAARLSGAALRPRTLLVTAARVTSVLAFATLMSVALLLPLTGMIGIPARPAAHAGPRRRPALPARLPRLNGGAAAGRDRLPVTPVRRPTTAYPAR